MEGYLGAIEARLAQFHDRLVALERAAGDALAKAREDLAAEKYVAENPNETPEIAAAKKALADHVAETAAKQAALDEAIAKQEADAKAAAEAEAEGEVPSEPAGPVQPFPEVDPTSTSERSHQPAKAAELADADETF